MSNVLRHVYVHVPYCARRCAYCDFAIAVRREVPWRAFADRIAAELRVRRLSAWAPLDTLYVGGGTPSRLGAEGVRALLQVLGGSFTWNAKTEVTLEANPEDVSTAAAAAWREAGVNRVSLGVQSFDPDVLAWMHRLHAPQRAAEAVAELRAAGIDNISLDLIYAVPNHLGRDWVRDVQQAIDLRPDHLSCYGLTVEPKTPLGKWVSRGDAIPALDESHESQFLEAHALLTAAGYTHYEVSNYGFPTRHSRHNSAYWAGVPYIGVGPSAHGFEGKVRRWNLPSVVSWERALEIGRDPVEAAETLTTDQQAIESVYLGLRTLRGCTILPGDAELMAQWEAAGWAKSAEGVMRLTPTGWLRLDAIAAALTHHRSRY